MGDVIQFPKRPTQPEHPTPLDGMEEAAAIFTAAAKDTDDSGKQ